ncbi:MAG: hypothetical protein HC906_08905 [Bacteroidales bacterium]|nr:hypothetical protein [Bacteroidales bacterium]
MKLQSLVFSLLAIIFLTQCSESKPPVKWSLWWVNQDIEFKIADVPSVISGDFTLKKKVNGRDFELNFFRDTEFVHLGCSVSTVGNEEQSGFFR